MLGTLHSRLMGLRKRQNTSSNDLATDQADSAHYLESQDAPLAARSTMFRVHRTNLSEELGSLRQRLRQYSSILDLVSQEIAGSTANSGVSRELVAKTQALDHLALYCLESIGGRTDLAEQLEPGVSVLVDQLESSLAQIQLQIGRWNFHRELIAELTELFAKIQAGDTSHASRWRELAESIVARMDQEWYPHFSIGTEELPIGWQAEHAANLAQVIAYLASSESHWRAQRESLVTAALLQNIGMLQIPPRVLLSPGELGARELHELRRHTSNLGPFLSQIPGIEAESARAAVCHHERLDGSGYPHGLNGTILGPSARLFAVADSFVGRLGRRPHRPSQTAKQAMMEILGEAEEGKLDYDWAVALLRISFFPIGSKVELATGDFAEVVAPQDPGVHPNLAALPIVRVLSDASGKAAVHDVLRNLALRPDCRIVRVIEDQLERNAA